MTIEQFTVQPTFVILVAIVLSVIGIIVLVTGLSSRLYGPAKSHNFGKGMSSRWVLIIVGLTVIGLGVGLFAFGGMPSTITVGSSYVHLQSSPLFGVGDINISSSEIASAYVAQIGSGNLSLPIRQNGISAGNLNLGVFTLGNGHTAYVASTNSTDLIIQLNNGKYVILGTSNTTALASSFSQNVYPLKSP
jgi:hypothetical protein